MQKRIQEFFNRKEPNTPISLDETVASGAHVPVAVLAVILIGDGSSQVQDLLLFDVAQLCVRQQLES